MRCACCVGWAGHQTHTKEGERELLASEGLAHTFLLCAQRCAQVACEQSNDARVFSERKYWNGYWWRITIDKEAEGQVAVYIMPSVGLEGYISADDSKPGALTYGIQVGMGQCVDHVTSCAACHMRCNCDDHCCRRAMGSRWMAAAPASASSPPHGSFQPRHTAGVLTLRSAASPSPGMPSGQTARPGW